MSETKKNTKKTTKKSYHSRRTIATFWICLVLVLAPFIVMGWILGTSLMDRGTPIFGNRYKGDLDPAITKKNLEAIDESVAKIDGVKAEFSNLSTATLRVYVQMSAETNEEAATAMTTTVYETISKTLDPSVYFTQHDGEKMYDLEIHVYNMGEDEDRSADTFVYVVSTKTSNMEAPVAQTVSKALSEDLANQLRQDVIDRKAQEEAEANATPSASATAASEEGA